MISERMSSMKTSFFVNLGVKILVILTVVILSGSVFKMVTADSLFPYPNSYESKASLGQERLQNSSSLFVLKYSNLPSSNQGKDSQTSENARLIIYDHFNNTGCSAQCISTSNSSITITGNNSKPLSVKPSPHGTTIALRPGKYAVDGPKVSGFYGQILSPDCSGSIKAGETKECVISNSYSNNIQTWIDKQSGIKIQFTYSPPYPFVENDTQLSFQTLSLGNNKPLEISHIHITVIKNVTASFNNTKTINDKNNFVTFENITSSQGSFSIHYRFLEEGAHQVIVNISTKENEIALASFNIPILFPE
jgi:hypothetical protein